VSSTLLRVELTRAVARSRRTLASDARDLLLGLSYVAIDHEIVDGAMNEPDRSLRSLDAIHLATARLLADDLTAIVSYDDRPLAAAKATGMAYLSPRD
jgi:uncharacterized protein